MRSTRCFAGVPHQLVDLRDPIEIQIEQPRRLDRARAPDLHLRGLAPRAGLRDVDRDHQLRVDHRAARRERAAAAAGEHDLARPRRAPLADAIGEGGEDREHAARDRPRHRLAAAARRARRSARAASPRDRPRAPSRRRGHRGAAGPRASRACRASSIASRSSIRSDGDEILAAPAGPRRSSRSSRAPTQRRDHARLVADATAFRLAHQPAEPRVHREPQHPPAEGGDLASLDRAEPHEQLLGRRRRDLRRRLVPAQRRGATTPRRAARARRPRDPSRATSGTSNARRVS